MQQKLKKILVSALVVTMMLPMGSIIVLSESTEDNGGANSIDNGVIDNGNDADDDDEPDEELVSITEDEAFDMTTLVTENDKFAMYIDEVNERMALVVKENGFIWWSAPFNADADPAGKTAQREAQKSALSVKYGDIAQRRSGEVYSFRESSKKERTKYNILDNGLEVSYSINTAKAVVPVNYILHDDYLEVYIDTARITEKDASALDGRVVTNLSILPQFGSGTPDEDGYIVIPDGSGTVINFNNGKQNYSRFAAKVYGNDSTQSLLTAPRVTEQITLPVFGIVKEDNALVAIATDGDANATIRASVSGQSGSSYNSCYFDFEVRSSDNYYMTGQSTSLLVFEKNGIKVPRVGVRYYPVSKSDVNYVDVAETYRNYLIAEKDLQKKTAADTNPLYIDLFGGVMKKTSVLGIPLDLRTSITSFDDASKIINTLSDNGISDMVVNYNEWTNGQIKGNLSTNAKASSTLGGKKDFNNMIENFESKNVEFYPGQNNFQFNSSSAGFISFTNTAIRISNAYAKMDTFDLAFGTPNRGSAPSLFSPASYQKLFDKVVKSYDKRDLNSISLGAYANTLASDFSNSNPMNRTDTQNKIVDIYKQANESIGNVLADGANAYVAPYASHIVNVPISSSGYDLSDYDIPFYQMVFHGYIPLASTPINEDADFEKSFMLNMASGTSVHYDFIHNSASDIIDTDYDTLFYASYEGWLENSIGYHNLSNEVIKSVSDQTITGYEFISDSEIQTTYSNGTVTIVNTETSEITVNGNKFALADYVKEGATIG